VVPTVLDPSTLRYQPFYCEENIYHLSQHPHFAARSPAALFVSGLGGECVMWHQKQARRPGAPLSWDYHVLLLVRDPWEIWDFDTTLGFPVPAAMYLRRSFRPELDIPAELTPWFRRVNAAELAATFASDRSHMRDRRGAFQRPPPPWPAIGAEGVASNLGRFLTREDAIAGEVMDLPALLARVKAA
jgi:protein N-terminal glutamine amidohydrolase